MEKDLIFECKKCGHNLYVSKDLKKIQKLLKLDCPNCGEDGAIWTLIGEGILTN